MSDGLTDRRSQSKSVLTIVQLEEYQYKLYTNFLTSMIETENFKDMKVETVKNIARNLAWTAVVELKALLK